MAVKRPKVSPKIDSVGFACSSRINWRSFAVVIVVTVISYLVSKFVNYKASQEFQHSEITKPKYWNVSEAKWNPNGNLRTMNRVFERLGYEFVNASQPGEDWDVLWSIELVPFWVFSEQNLIFLCRYPFHLSLKRLFGPLYQQPLKPHQKINHFPGIGVLADKSFLSTRHRDLKYILPAFSLLQKDEFQSYVAKNPKRKFVEKNIKNRGVKIIEKKDIDFSLTYKIYQAFLENPMLIDGRGFDMGVYGKFEFSLQVYFIFLYIFSFNFIHWTTENLSLRHWNACSILSRTLSPV